MHLQNTVFSPLPHLSEAIKIVWISINLWNILISFFVKICYRYRKTCCGYFPLFKRKPRPWAKNDIAVAFRTFLVMRSIKSEAIKTVRISINCFGFHLILSKQSQGRAKLRHTSFIGNQSVTLQTFFSSFLKVFLSDPSSLAIQNKNSNSMTAFLRLSQISTRISTWAELNF